jgi:hypothetical protein
MCNSLVSNIGLTQVRKNGAVEKRLLTCGDGLAEIARFIPEGRASYTARDVIDKLLEFEA